VITDADLKRISGPIDVEGGWFDAGDYLKFTHTTAYNDVLLYASARAVGGSTTLAEARVGSDWLTKMWDATSKTLYLQVGIGSGNAAGTFTGDHDLWRRPQADDGNKTSADRYAAAHRPVFEAAAPGKPISPNLVGRVSAAFALAAQADSDSTRARADLTRATSLDAMAATASPPNPLVTALPNAFYPEGTWRDDMELGATEIALGAQWLDRFRRRFGAAPAEWHSDVSQSTRRDTWRAVADGRARVVVGARSALFLPFAELGLIVVDEEHDASYKQHEGFRYSARDLAVVRARGAGVPVILGSATPSLETLENAASGRYIKHLLPQRPGAAQPPRMALVDLRRHAAEQGLSGPALQAIDQHLRAAGQVIVFLNRRGYAPSLFCNSCGWVAPCAHCDARMTLHRRAQQLRCHHCGAVAAVPTTCASCSQALLAVGQGTERVEETLARLFPDAPLARLDRDSAAGRGSIQSVLDRVHSGEALILIGTQMLTKGHHFPDVTLVVILDADQGLFASDFRATERLAQTITQVAGRAGRETRAGEVMIQTEFPEHPLLNRLIAQGYESFAASALEERREAGWPPFSRLALLRAEAKDSAELHTFLRTAADAGLGLGDSSVKILGPAAALIARRADHFRAHLLVETPARSALQRFLSLWLPQVEALPGPKGLRWSIDVDPLEVD